MPNSSTQVDPWGESSQPMTAGPTSISGSVETTASTTSTGAQSASAGPLTARIERSRWTREDVELALQAAYVGTTLLLAYMALKED